MNKLLTVLISTLGAFNVVFSIFMPIAIVLLLIVTFTSSALSNNVLLTIGLLATLYRGIKFLILE